MDLVNRTPYQAALYRSSLMDERRRLAVVVLKATYLVARDGNLSLDTEEPVPVSRATIATPSGDLPGDESPRKEGVDLLALGWAYPAGGRPAPLTEVRWTVGDFSARLAVFGERRWDKAHGVLAPSAPAPFERMALTWENAYGGMAALSGLRLPFAENPAGKGFVLDATCAPGTALPTVEDPERLIQSWEDRPRPASFAPLPIASALRADVGGQNPVSQSYNHAHPALRVASLRGGERVEVLGMSPDGPLQFVLPRAAFDVEVALEERRYRFPARVDTLCVLAEERRVVVTHRCGFTYRFVREESRTATIRLSSEERGATSCAYSQ